MLYDLPESTFNAREHARNKILRANQFKESIIQQFITEYEDFWGIDHNGGSRHTTEEMQAILDAMPMATAIDILTDASGFKDYLNMAYPGQLDEKYHESAWAYIPSESGITLTELRPAWQEQGE